MELSLWAARLERPLGEREEQALLRLLPDARRERLGKLGAKRREPLCAYLLLRTALSRSLGWRELPRMESGRFGKPFFPDFQALQFNLSHTEGAVLVGLHEEPLGVDIERLRPLGEQMKRRLAPEMTEQAFFENWVRRESRSKRAGNGIGGLLREETPPQEGERFYLLETFPGYAAGLASCSRCLPEAVRRFSMEELLGELF